MAVHEVTWSGQWSEVVHTNQFDCGANETHNVFGLEHHGECHQCQNLSNLCVDVRLVPVHGGTQVLHEGFGKVLVAEECSLTVVQMKTSKPFSTMFHEVHRAFLVRQSGVDEVF